MQTFHCQIAKRIEAQSDQDFLSVECQIPPQLPVELSSLVRSTGKLEFLQRIIVFMYCSFKSKLLDFRITTISKIMLETKNTLELHKYFQEYSNPP